MATVTLKCKSCGNTITIDGNQAGARCDYCGNFYEAPQSEERDKILNLQSRADDAWDRKCFDEALELYEEIINIDYKNAEAHFAAALCQYGISYVKDPATERQVPTCNRFNRKSFLENKNYQLALKYASAEAQVDYKRKGEYIEKITKDFLTIVEKEKPYDVFISYKKTDDNGKNTEDSERAKKLYFHLTEKGFKVFLAEMTLDKISGDRYEPYIFAAISSAPVMILMGSSAKYMESTWVKNEWKRFLNLKAQGEKKTLLLCCIKMKPEELPLVFRDYQAIDACGLTFNEEMAIRVGTLVSDARVSRPAVEARSLADLYASPEKVQRLMDKLDCSELLASESLQIHRGNIDKSIAYILDEDDYKKAMWICTECNTYNTHDVCHNPSCGITKADSVKIQKKREAINRNTAEEKRKRAAKLRKYRPAILIASAVVAVFCIVFGIIGGVQVNKVNKLLEKIPDTISDYSRFENEIVAVYTAYDGMWGVYKGFVDEERLDTVMDGFNVYRVDSIKAALSEITVENAKDSDILSRLATYYKQLTPEQSGMLNKEEFGKLESMNCAYDTIVAIDTLMNDVVANYGTLSDIHVKYDSLSDEDKLYVHNYGKLDGIEDYYNLYSNLVFTAADGGWSVSAKSTGITGDVVLPSVYQGQEVKTIPEGAFKNCSAINSVVVPDTVTSIGEGAFSGCIGLKSITLPFVGQTRTASKGEGCFGYIFGSGEYTGGTGTRQYYSGTYYYIPSQLRSVTITDATQITESGFENCSMLTEINLNDGIIAINTESFANCSGIKTIHLPNITDISENAFSGCGSLERFIIGEDVTTISESAFAGCMSLIQINSEEDGTYIIPNSITSIGEGAFSGCIGLKSITLPFVGQTRTASKGEGCFGYIFGSGEYTGGTGTRQYYSGTYYYIPSQLRSVTITDATQITESGFENCSMLTSLKINKAAKATIGDDAFGNCVSPKYY